MNDQMTQLATTFMESQIEDPKLREVLRPNSKCMPSKLLFLPSVQAMRGY